MKAPFFIIILGVVWVSGLWIAASDVRADTSTSTSFILIDSFSFGPSGSSASGSTTSGSRGGVAPAQGGSSTNFKTAAPLATSTGSGSTTTRTARGTQAVAPPADTGVAPQQQPTTTTPPPSGGAPQQEPTDAPLLPQQEQAAPTTIPASSGTSVPPDAQQQPETSGVIERAIEAVTKPVKQLFGARIPGRKLRSSRNLLR
ncbi:hypothetical protein HZA86_01090 [Candidatus Uhrbacteria bacterium]|nr:hypothetical protein [Candidatus Uhrbacteria bacterium]